MPCSCANASAVARRRLTTPIEPPAAGGRHRARVEMRDRSRADESEAQLALVRLMLSARAPADRCDTPRRGKSCAASTLSNGRICVNNTAAMSFFGSTQNSVLAAPSQKNSPTAPEASLASLGGAMRTAKSMPKPTCPLPGSHDLSVTSCRHGVGGHELHGLGLEDARAAQLAATRQHARELHVVVDGGHEAEAAGLERPGCAVEFVRLLVRLAREACRHRCACTSAASCGRSGIGRQDGVARARHAQRPEDVQLEELCRTARRRSSAPGRPARRRRRSTASASRVDRPAAPARTSARIPPACC